MPNNITYYAHTLPGRPASEWQSLADHSAAVAALAAEFADAFGLGSMGEAAGLLHDVGKSLPPFQDNLHLGNSEDNDNDDDDNEDDDDE